MIRVGCHLSIAGGFSRAARSAAALGCETLQMFSRSPRGGKAKPLDSKDVEGFRRITLDHDIAPQVVHVPYYLNMASEALDAQQYTQDILVDEMCRAQELGASYVITHLGHGADDDAYVRVLRMLERVVEQAACCRVELLLENAAGQGSEMGWSFEQIGFVFNECALDQRLGFCLDTCHAFAAGYDLATADGFRRTLQQVEKHIGLERLKIIHANDAKEPLGSRKDRHEHIGEGHIGEEGFRRLLTARELSTVSAVLETPQTTSEANMRNLQALKRLRS